MCRVGWATAVVLLLAGLCLPAAAQVTSDRDLPVIVDVDAPPRVRVGTASEVRLSYRAPRADIVAVVQAIEDLDGPAVSRSTREQEFRVVARAFGFESGELRVPLSFTTPGLKRVTLTLVTDQGARSDPAIVEVDVEP